MQHIKALARKVLKKQDTLLNAEKSTGGCSGVFD
jgi:hypothetical protein